MLKLAGHSGAVRSLAYSPDGTRLVSGGEDRQICFWSASGELIQKWSGSRTSVECVAFSSDSTTVLAGVAGGRFYAFDSKRKFGKRGGKPSDEADAHPRGVVSIVVIPNVLKSAITVGWDRRILWWDLNTFKSEPFQNVLEQAPSAVALAQSRFDSLAIAARQSPRITLVEFDLRGMHGTLDYRGAPAYSLSFSPDGSWLAAGDADGTIWLWRLDAKDPPIAVRAHEWTIYGLAFTPDSRRLVSGGADGKVMVWDVESRRRLHMFDWHESWITCLAIAPDGMTAATGSQDSTIAIWDMPE